MRSALSRGPRGDGHLWRSRDVLSREAQSLGGAHAVVKGDGDVVWPLVLNDAAHGNLKTHL